KRKIATQKKLAKSASNPKQSKLVLEAGQGQKKLKISDPAVHEHGDQGPSARPAQRSAAAHDPSSQGKEINSQNVYITKASANRKPGKKFKMSGIRKLGEV